MSKPKKKRPTAGRPPGPVDPSLTHVLYTRVSDETYDALRAMCDERIGEGAPLATLQRLIFERVLEHGLP